MDLHPLLLLLPLLSVCLLSCSGTTSGEPIRVNVGSEAVLPCFISPKRDIRQDVFDWKKDDQKEVFFYEKGSHYNNDREGQDEQFKGRVFHFPDQLQFGNASIVIRDTIMNDSGTYSCDYSPDQPNRQTYNIELVVDACPKPHLVSHDQSKHMSMLKCKVQGASPKPKVELKDSSGDTLHAVETLVPKTGGSYDIILQINVTKTDTYHCVVTQEEICHQVSEEIPVHLPGFPIGWIVGAVLITLLVVGGIQAVLVAKGRIKLNCKKGSQKEKEKDEKGDPSASDKQELQPLSV